MNIESSKIVVSSEEARQKWLEYRHSMGRVQSTPEDREIMSIYKQLAKGGIIINAVDAIARAGLNTQQLPNLAICRADAQWCYLHNTYRGSYAFSIDQGYYRYRTKRNFVIPENSLPGIKHKYRSRALVPLIPLPLRPSGALSKYHILWEAEWEPFPPRDPILLRRLSGNLFLVVAAWDLTPVEMGVLSKRIRADE